jgi:predicted nucleic acid-binding protein
MKRTLVQFDKDTYNTLRRRAFCEKRSVSSLVREMVGQGLKTVATDRPSRVSLVDQISFLVMRRRQVDTAFAFDPDFVSAGFHLVEG